MTADNAPPIITIRLHHEDPALVLLDTPPSLSQRMGHFRPARYVGLRAGSYVLAVDHLEALTTFAASQRITLVDDRHAGAARARTTTVGPARPLPECSTCSAPASREHQPGYCQACGQPWQPIEPDALARPITTDTCTNCHGTQRAGHAYCGRCGAPVDPTPAAQPQTAQPPPRPRTHLPEPLPIAVSIDELLEQQATAD